MTYCVYCGNKSAEEARFCPKCGRQIPIEPDRVAEVLATRDRTCGKCGKPMGPVDRECWNCGRKEIQESTGASHSQEPDTSLFRSSSDSTPVSVTAFNVIFGLVSLGAFAVLFLVVRESVHESAKAVGTISVCLAVTFLVGALLVLGTGGSSDSKRRSAVVWGGLAVAVFLGGRVTSALVRRHDVSSAAATSPSSAPVATAPSVPMRSEIEAPTPAPRNRDGEDRIGVAAIVRNKILAFAFQDARVDEELAIIVSGGTLFRGDEVNANEDMIIRSLENGWAFHKGRRLPAAVLRLEVPTVNRAEGVYRSFCVTHATVFDSEFNVWRAPLYWGCNEESRGEQSLEYWKATVRFQPE